MKNLSLSFNDNAQSIKDVTFKDVVIIGELSVLTIVEVQRIARTRKLGKFMNHELVSNYQLGTVRK